MDGQMVGIIAAILGGVLGLGGGVLGTYSEITKAQSKTVRFFVIKSAFVGLFFIAGFVTALLVLPEIWRKFLWVPYSILLPAGILYFNQHMKLLEAKEIAD